MELHQAASIGDLPKIKELIRQGVNINDTLEPDNVTALHDVVWKDHHPIIEYLLNHGIEIDAQNNNGNTALNTACFYGHHDSVQILLKRGADHKIANNHCYTPIETAINYGFLEVIAVFLEEDLELKRIRKAVVSLFKNTVKDYEKEGRFVKACLEKSVAVEEIRPLARDFYQQAAMHNNVQLAKLLCEKYFDLVGDVLHRALEERNDVIAFFLIRNKLAINTLDSEGQSPLYVAAKLGNLEAVKCLQENGAVNRNIDDCALSVALKNLHNDVADYLYRHK